MKKRKGYWLGKKKDQHTLDRLSESKNKTVLEYDIDGNFIKEWESIKSVAINVFNDYKIVNGGSKSKIYTLLKNKRTKNKMAYNNDHWSYWFSREEILEIFNDVPSKIDVKEVDDYYKTKINESRKGKSLYQRKYRIIEYNENGIVNEFDDAKEARDKLGCHISQIYKHCKSGKVFINGNYIKYGDKKISFIKEYD